MMRFIKFPKMGRYSRQCVVTEKIDGTNAQLFIVECDGHAEDEAVFQKDGLALFAGSRKRWITPKNDNFGFAAWVYNHGEELLTLGPGLHFGEWWGSGIQRGYGLEKDDKRFSLFNTVRWCLHEETPAVIPTLDPRITKMQDVLPECVGLVPVLWRGAFDDLDMYYQIENLEEHGSYAAPGFMNPEGVVAFHTAGNVGFKKTIKKDDVPKSRQEKMQA